VTAVARLPLPESKAAQFPPHEALPVQYESADEAAAELLRRMAPGLPHPPQELPPGAPPLEAAPPVEVAPPPALMPAPRERVPLTELDATGEVRVTGSQSRLSLVVRDAPLNKVLAVLAQQMQLNIVCGNEVSAVVTITLQDVPLEDALTSILSIAGCTWVRHRGIIHVTSASAASSLAPETQGRQMRVFPLHYALAGDVDPVVRGLLSPVGRSFFTASSPADNRKTQETLVVEDLPPYLDRVAEFLAHADVPPRQVLIEAHVMQIDLKDENRHGVNLSYLSEIAGKDLSIELRGMANPLATQAVLFTFNGTDLSSLLELLKTTTDSKTLASPRVLVVNGQEARIQVGAQLGFRVTTTTQTSTMESVNFLDVGVVLRVTPRISPAGDVLMHVKPEVSSGQVNPTTGLPEEETTEVETDILLHDGQGVVIGGLIQENASDVQNKLPLLGDLPLIGRLFQHRVNNKSRSEIVIALVPRVVPFDPHYQAQTESDLYRATSPILDCQLRRLPRDDGYTLHDCKHNPIRPFRRLYRLPPVDCPPYLGPTHVGPMNAPPPSAGAPIGPSPATGEVLPPPR
jgi:type II secretory pathway component GspD/PulD (secretin)